MSDDNDDFIQMIKNEINDSDESILMEEEMPSEVIHDNITEVVEMDFADTMANYIDDSEIDIKMEGDLISAMDDDDDESLILQAPTDHPPKLTSISGIKFLNKKTITFAEAQQSGLIPSVKRQTPVQSSRQILSSTPNTNHLMLPKQMGGKRVSVCSGTSGFKNPIKIIPNASQNVYTSSLSSNTPTASGNSAPMKFILKTASGEFIPMKPVVLRQPNSTPGSTGKVQIVQVSPNQNRGESFSQNIKTETVSSEPVFRTVQSTGQNTYKQISISGGVRQVLAKTPSGQQIRIPIGDNVTQMQSSQVLNTNTVSNKSGQIYILQTPTSTSTNQSTPYRIQINRLQNSDSGQKFIKVSPAQIKQDPDYSLLERDNYPDSDEDNLLSNRSKSPLEANGVNQRKPCNCTKSQCLKLYCECFANGEFCNNCNCVNCFNNLKNEEERQKAIKSCLERNPSAFRPKIGKLRDLGEVNNRKHTKGCNCKKSGCLKNYCECYEAKIFCSANCKCFGCRNSEDTTVGRKTIGALKAATEAPELDGKTDQIRKEYSSKPLSYYFSLKPSTSDITDEVIEATCHSLLSLAEDASSRENETKDVESIIIEDFGRCLKEIIDYRRGN